MRKKLNLSTIFKKFGTLDKSILNQGLNNSKHDVNNN